MSTVGNIPFAIPHPRWALFRVSFRPQQEVKTKLGDGQNYFVDGPLFHETTVYVHNALYIIFSHVLLLVVWSEGVEGYIVQHVCTCICTSLTGTNSLIHLSHNFFFLFCSTFDCHRPRATFCEKVGSVGDGQFSSTRSTSIVTVG